MDANFSFAAASPARSLAVAASRSLCCLSASACRACRLFCAVLRSSSALATRARVDSSLLSVLLRSRRFASCLPASVFAFSTSARAFCTCPRSFSSSLLNPVTSVCVWLSSLRRTSSVASNERISSRRFCSTSFSARRESRCWRSFSTSSRNSAACLKAAGSGAGEETAEGLGISEAGGGLPPGDRSASAEIRCTTGLVTSILPVSGVDFGTSFLSRAGMLSVSPFLPSSRLGWPLGAETDLEPPSEAMPFGARSRNRLSNWPNMMRSPPLTRNRSTRLPLTKVPLEDFKSTIS